MDEVGGMSTESGSVSWSSVGDGVERVVLGGVFNGFGGVDIAVGLGIGVWLCYVSGIFTQSWAATFRNKSTETLDIEN